MNRFRWRCLLQIVLLTGSLWAWLHWSADTPQTATSVLFGIFIAIQIIMLIRFVEKSNRDVIRFLDGLRYGDFSQSFKKYGKITANPALGQAMEAVMQAFQKERREKEAHFLYLQTLVKEA